MKKKPPTKKQIIKSAKRLLSVLSLVSPSDLPRDIRVRANQLGERVGSKHYFPLATIVNLAGYQRGIEEHETGFDLKKFGITIQKMPKKKGIQFKGQSFGALVRKEAKRRAKK